MNFSAYYNNVAINAFAISSVLKHAGFLTLPKLALILPIVAHRDMVKQLANGNFRVVSFEQYLIDNIGNFSNFNERYLGSITATVNALQFLAEIGIVWLEDDGVLIKFPIPFDRSMGKRAERIQRASANIAALISGDANVFYLNARIEL
ncbi:DUF6521 family protein [Ensifer adhaerens]|nr:DUF6521 family protein [Ensifer adhaerens]UAY05030.1 DUF6521 family protein [Ensifer adhaerens]UAY12450.1 DUF6521 family protein [Ensifer adhaerens]